VSRRAHRTLTSFRPANWAEEYELQARRKKILVNYDVNVIVGA
jgi:hypothetical protein